MARSPDSLVTRSPDPISFRASYNELNHMPLGLYVSVPFCRSKCSFCNFASGVFSRERMSGYIARLQQEIAGVDALAASLDAAFDREVNSIYIGGGTPTTLAPNQLASIF